MVNMIVVDFPVVQILLLAVIFLSIIVEIKTGGLGVGVLLGMVAAAVFWGSQYVKGLVDFYHIAVFLAGILLIAIEIVLPTIGILAGVGVAAMLYSIVLTMGGDISALSAMGISLLIAGGVFMLIASRLPSSRLWNKVVLHEATSTEQGYVSTPSNDSLLGKSGLSSTELRPAGTVIIDGNPVDVVSEGIFIEKGAAVIVAAVNGSRIVVRRI